METTDSDFFPKLKCHLKPLFLLNNSLKHLLHLCSYLPPFSSTTVCQELCSILFFCILRAPPLAHEWPQTWVQGGTQNIQHIVSENDEYFGANKSWLFLPTSSQQKETLGLLAAFADPKRGLCGMRATGWNRSHQTPCEPCLWSRD